MRVKCKKIKSDGKNISDVTDGWFTVGNEYIVIGISFNSQFEPKYLLFSEKEECPVLREMSFFEMVDSKAPSSWYLAVCWNQDCLLEPKAFDKPQFWDDFHSGKEWARTLFQDTYTDLLTEDRAHQKKG